MSAPAIAKRLRLGLGAREVDDRVLRERLEERVEGGLPVQVEVEALGQGGGLGWPAHPVEVPDVVDVVLPGEPGVERDVAGDVADTSVQVVAVRPRVEAEQLGTARRGPRQAHDDAQRRRLAGAVGAR
ncbi:hypothetical protein GCM10009721_15020 [Terrabacter tumescens]|uniref:Uncharacterized protein n=1 Tax=Terrabacter tumescens TaxID=60443 RepID=A0ABQ2HSQ8_9MICO|nr:hypothetical protein GCM10009721_15020 [Terrabacter tumescens]